jgi:hypothetical protein
MFPSFYNELAFVWKEPRLRTFRFVKKFNIKPGGFELVGNERINICRYELCQNGISCMDQKI